jgi:hypothetical protein
VQHFFETSPQLKGAPRNPELILSLKCKLSRVLDLTDASIVKALGTSLEELVAPRFIAEAEKNPELASIRTTWKQLTPTQQLGLACFQSRNISALKAPSAACKAVHREGLCIDMLFDNFVPGEFVQVYDSTGRITQSKKAGDKNILDLRN